MTDQAEGRLNSLSDFLKPIFLKWEKLRIPYNLILALVLILSHGQSMGARFFHPLALSIWLTGAVLANLCFFAGPLAEAYIAWLGLRSRVVTVVLFVGGVLISIPCVLCFVPLWFFGFFAD
jgi:hypothetical protein